MVLAKNRMPLLVAQEDGFANEDRPRKQHEGEDARRSDSSAEERSVSSTCPKPPSRQ